MPSSKCYVITYQDQKVLLRYPTDKDVAVKEGGSKGKFQELRLLERLAAMKLKGTYVDVGANVGNHTVYFARFTMADVVVSVEAHPEIAQCLRINVRRNRDETPIRVIEAAAWHRREELWMDAPVPGNSGRSQICGLGKFGVHPKHSVTGRPLDELLGEYDDISVVKIDVEDAEVQALNGMRRVLDAQRPVLVTEAHTKDLLAQQKKILDGYDYKLDKETFDPRGETRLWTPTSKA